MLNVKIIRSILMISNYMKKRKRYLVATVFAFKENGKWKIPEELDNASHVLIPE